MPQDGFTPRDDTMDVIRGTGSPKRSRWWAPRPNLRLVREQRNISSGGDPFAFAMIGLLCLFVLAFSVFMGAWTGTPPR